MRHLLASFLTLHWAVVFALMAFACIDGGHGVAMVFSAFGATVPSSLSGSLGNVAVAAPLAVAFAIVSLLFCWAFVGLIGGGEARSQDADGIVRIAFIAAVGVPLAVMAVGAVLGVKGLYPVVAIHLTAIMTSYLAMLGERWAVQNASQPVKVAGYPAARAMAQAAAHNSTLARISGRGPARSGKVF